MCYLKGSTLKGFGVHCIGVVLGGDFHLTGGKILYGMISSPVTELKLVGLRTVCKGNDLMSQANTKDGIITLQGFYSFNGGNRIRGISRAV